MSKPNARETLTPKSGRAFALALSSQGTAPEWVMLLPAGPIETNDGRNWVNDRPEVIVAHFKSGGLDLPFDFEHGAEKLAPTGVFVPAAGWIVDVANRDGEIWAKVQWTERGRAAIESKEVRYVSPAFIHEIESGRIISLSSAALCLSPAISSLPAIASRQTQQEETEKMDRKALCQKLKLPETASDAEIFAAIDKLESDTAIALASAKMPDLNQYVPRADYTLVAGERDRLQTEIASRQADDLKAEAAALVEQGIKERKITPASKDYYLSTCSTREGVDKFKAFITSAPAVIPAGAGADPADTTTGKALTSIQKQAARQLGISQEEYAKQLQADAAEKEEA